MKGKKRYLVPGLVGAFTGITCCVAPVILILLGFGTAVSMAFMHQFHIVSVFSGVILMLLISLYLIKRKEGVCNVKTMKSNWPSIIASVVTMIVILLAIDFLIVSPIATVVYGNLEVEQKPTGNLAEMAASHGMPEMANIEVVPENQGEKMIVIDVKGVYCGSCGPAIGFDLRSVLGVNKVEQEGNVFTVYYDSDVTSKDVIMATIHAPYSGKIIEEKIV